MIASISDYSHLLTAVCLLVGGIFAYFLPTFSALLGRHRNAAAIFILNFLTGWTFLGWVIALVWSFCESQPTVLVYHDEKPKPKL